MSRKKPVIGVDLEGPERPLHIIWRDYQQVLAECHKAEANLADVMARFGLVEPRKTAPAAPQQPAAASVNQPPLFDLPSA